MQRLINAESLKELFPDNGEGSWTYNATAKAYIDAQPTIQPDIIHCKDCKWYEIEQLKRDGTDDKRYKPSVCVIGAYAEPRKADWYCADGERREDGNNDRN